MRTVFIGAGEVSIGTAKALVKKGHEVIIIETDKAKIDELSEEMDCSFLQGDGSRPDILREVNPEQTDILFCLTDSDQVNVIGSLVGCSLGFKRVVTSIRDEQFEVICHELAQLPQLRGYSYRNILILQNRPKKVVTTNYSF